MADRGTHRATPGRSAVGSGRGTDAGLGLRIQVVEEQVEAGAGLVVVEAMKMENEPPVAARRPWRGGFT